jgi:Tfp pilus assembly protein PilF
MTNLGLIAASSNSPERALYYYNKALSLDPDFETALVNKSALLIYQKKNSEAKAVLEHLIKKHPNNRQAEGILKSLL